MKLEAGKYYRTRDGRKAYVAGVNPETTLFPGVGWIEGLPSPMARSWRLDGRYSESECYRDLVVEWVEPRTLTLDFTMYARRDGSVYAVDSDNITGDRVLAHKTFTITEGDGMEGTNDGR